MKVVIVTYNWPPRNAIGTHRPYSWARHWSEAGAEITILTAKKQAFDAPLDLTLPELPGVKVVEVPYGRATGLVNTFLKSDLARRLAKRVKALIDKRIERSTDPRMAWRGAARSVAHEIAQNANIVVSTFGPPAAHLIANDMKLANPNLRWVADYRDLWSQRYDSGASHEERARSQALECRTVGSNADLITAVSEDMVRQLRDLTGKQVLCVLNGFDIDLDTVRSRLLSVRRQPQRPFRIAHTGTLYEGSRDATPLLKALVALQQAGKIEHGAVTIDYYGSRVDAARKLAQDETFKPFIRIMGHVDRDRALAAQCAADVLLLLESPAPEARGILTGKLFEYMSAGRPILCIGSLPEYEIGKVLTKTGTGIALGPEKYNEIEDIILSSINGSGLIESFDPKMEEIEKFSRKKIAAKLFKKIKIISENA